MNILSLDMSTKSSGWALFEDKKLKMLILSAF